MHRKWSWKKCGSQSYILSIHFCFLAIQNCFITTTTNQCFSHLMLTKKKSSQFYPEPTWPFVRCPLISFPRSHKPLSHHCPYYAYISIIGAYFTVVVSIGTFYYADKQCWTLGKMWCHQWFFSSLASFKFYSGLLEMKRQDIKSWVGGAADPFPMPSKLMS